MQLHKTDRARAELKSGNRTLSQRERTLLLLADGNKSVMDFRPLFNGDGEEIALRMLREGFLQVQSGKAAEDARPPEPVAEKPQRAMPGSLPLSRNHPVPPAPARVSADQFDGKRSLATTRMFLFDICERMFSRKHPELAATFRDALRDARDRDAMLDASRRMIEEIEKITGHERADSISERIAMLLPDEQAD
ncbi:MAG: hypothetical protein H0W47_02540 [Polaromonas sp.]|uniref:hypothetical protein n=1 Tax=Polaromonas sp. TaxID=1869339 RepID=UPI0018249991|nr:hypothetical protein [Polaromonas sp.]MBA3592663.1 hypothetical protein [Polaromonas sp.]